MLHPAALEGKDGSVVRFRLLNGYAIVVKGSIGSLRGLNFILDTGAVPSVINQRIAEKLGIQGRNSQLSLFSQPLEARSLVVQDVRIGPVTTPSAEVLSEDLSSLEDRLGMRVDAIIGLDVLRTRRLRIDYASRKLSFDQPVSLAYSCPIQIRPGFVYVTVSVQDQKVLLVVDTGAKDLILFASRIKGRFGELRGSGIKTVHNMGGELTLQGILLHRVRVGEESLPEIQAFVLNNTGQTDPGFDGLLGVRALGASEIAFDFKENRISWR